LGSFVINHPDPSKYDTHQLIHTYVESPNEGDTLYRYEVEVVSCNKVIALPSYFKFLNKNPQVKVAPKNHFGRGYGVVDNAMTQVTINTSDDGIYNVLVIGTRNDICAVNRWRGEERFKPKVHTLEL